jgi:hypothetical protein
VRNTFKGELKMALWGTTDEDASVPTYLDAADNAKAFFIDTTEAAVASNRGKGLKTAGWNLYSTYTAASGETRHRAEVLVAMGRTAVQAGDDGTTGSTVDEDAVVADS